MKKRTRRDKEFWFIDISAFKNIANASSMMNTLSLDVDDDTFLYMFVAGDSARIWEMYKLILRFLKLKTQLKLAVNY